MSIFPHKIPHHSLVDDVGSGLCDLIPQRIKIYKNGEEIYSRVCQELSIEKYGYNHLNDDVYLVFIDNQGYRVKIGVERNSSCVKSCMLINNRREIIAYDQGDDFVFDDDCVREYLKVTF